MPVKCLAISKTIRQADQGELIGLPNERGWIDWAIVTDHNNNGLSALALLSSSEEGFQRPTSINYASDESCLSWGMDWVFEPLIEQGPFSRALRDRAGSWIIQDADVGLRLAGSQGEGTQAYTLNLTTFRRLDVLRNHAVGGQAWRVWASADEMANLKGKPLVMSTTERNAGQPAGTAAQ